MDKKSLYTFPPVDVQLQGVENYAAWALTMQYNFCAFGVWGYVQGKVKCLSDVTSPAASPAATSTDEASSGSTSSPLIVSDKLTPEKWTRTDEQIMAYIMHSVSIPIRLSIGRLTSSQEQWSALSRMFVQSGAAREYQLVQTLQDAKQNDRSIQEFYSLLSGYWEELQTMEVPIPAIVASSAPDFVLDLQRQRDRRNLFHFAMRLRPEFEALCGSLLHRSPLPSIMDAVCEFIAEEMRLRLLSSTQSLAPVTSALAASHASPQTSTVRGPPKVNPKVTCFYCKKPGHVVSACRARERVHGPYVPRSTPSSSPLAASGSSLSADQLAQFSAYLTQNLGISAGSSTTDATALSTTSGSASPWIFDSGATHHMTPDRSVISQPATPTTLSYIYTANGSRLSVSHTGNITPQSGISGKL